MFLLAKHTDFSCQDFFLIASTWANTISNSRLAGC